MLADQLAADTCCRCTSSTPPFVRGMLWFPAGSDRLVCVLTQSAMGPSPGYPVAGPSPAYSGMGPSPAYSGMGPSPAYSGMGPSPAYREATEQPQVMRVPYAYDSPPPAPTPQPAPSPPGLSQYDIMSEADPQVRQRKKQEYAAMLQQDWGRQVGGGAG